MRRNTSFLVCLFFLAASNCTRCQSKSPSTTPDATAGAPGRTNDLRTTLFTLFPEFRGARIVAGEAVLARELAWVLPEGTSLAEALAPYLAQKGFGAADGGSLGTRAPFHLTGERNGQNIVLAIHLPIGNDDVNKLLHTPSPLTTEHLAHDLPSPPGATTVRERFEMTIEYEAERSRADWLLIQLHGLLRRGGWRPTQWPDAADAGSLPPSFAGAFEHPESASKILVDRQPTRVRLSMQQTLR